MKKIDVLIVYEHVVRELESAILLKKKLQKKGLSVKIVQCAWTEPVARLKYKPKLLITPWCYDDVDFDFWRGYIGGYVGKKYKIINLHCEQLGSTEASEFLIPTGKSKEVYHFVWGEYFADLLVSNGVNKEKITVTGSPRIDFYKFPFSNISINKDELSKKYFLNPNKKWVLIIGNFSGAVLKNEDLSKLELRGYKNTDLLKEVVLKTYNDLIEWMNFVCASDFVHENCEIIYRPHPSEYETDVLKKLEEEFSCFHIIRDYTIRDWMLNSDVLYAWNSTSAIEAVFAEKPIWFLRPEPIPSSLQLPLLEKVEKIQSQEDFLESIKTDNVENLNELFKNDIKYYYDVNLKSTVDRMVDAIIQIIQDEGNLIVSRNIGLKDVIRILKLGLKKILLKIGVIKRLPKFSIDYKDFLNKKEYESYVKRIDQIGE